MTAPTLDGRLLCASGAAYTIDASQATLPLDPSNVYIAGAGFVRAPAVFAGGPFAVDACLVGEIADGIVVAFRGTLAPVKLAIPIFRDWLLDFQALPVSRPGFPGLVHLGFADALLALWPGVSVEVARQQASSPPGRPVLVTGHSKGGAVAGLAAWNLQQNAGIPVKVVTFAAARPADSAFRASYLAAGIDHTRYEYDDDIVPHVPLSTGGLIEVLSRIPLLAHQVNGLQPFDYQPVGTLRYIDAQRRIVADDPRLGAERDLSLALALIRLGFPQIASDHSISCGSGYMSAVAPTGVCP
jgi:hypothetical protein